MTQNQCVLIRDLNHSPNNLPEMMLAAEHSVSDTPMRKPVSH